MYNKFANPNYTKESDPVCQTNYITKTIRLVDCTVIFLFMVSKSGKKFADVSKLFDHAVHNGSNYLNSLCFVSVMLCVPVWKKSKIHYLSVPLGYRMWQKKKSKLELAVSMIQQIMPQFSDKKNVILLCDIWYVKKALVSIVEEYENLDLIGNARADSVIYDLAPQRTGKRGKPTLYGKKLSIYDDFVLSDEKSGTIYGGTPYPYEYFWQKRSLYICDVARKRIWQQTSVFQHHIYRTNGDFLRKAGEITTEPDRL